MSPAETLPLPFGRYILEQKLGSGTFADVYRATDTSLGRTVALKLLRPLLVAAPETLALFEQEARRVSGLYHPRIAPLHDFGQENGRYYLVMRFIEGPNLAELIQQRGHLPWEEAARITAEVGEALTYAHNLNLAHGDVKPQNILIHPKEGAVLTDFGLARIAETGSVKGSIRLQGTPAYMAPELWDGAPASPASDQYALACVLVEMLTGKVLYGASTPMAALKRHTQPPNLPAEWLQGIPTGLTHFLQKALAKDPIERFASIAEFSAELQKIQADEIARLRAEAEETKRKAEEEAVRKKEAEERAAAEAEARLKREAAEREATEAEAQRKAEQEVRLMKEAAEREAAEAERRRKAKEEAKRKREAKQKAEAEAEAQRKAAEDLQLKQQREKNRAFFQNFLRVGAVVSILLLALLIYISIWGINMPATLTPTAKTISQPLPTKAATLAPTLLPSATRSTPTTTSLAPGATQISPKDGMVLVYVPAGEFLMGSTDADKEADTDEKPQHTVYLDAFWIDQTEVTNAMYQKCVSDGKCTSRQTVGGADYPQIYVSWNDAKAYCEWAGRQLPSEAQWEKAARGTDGRLYPWGNQVPDETYLNYTPWSTEVRSYEKGKSPYGAYDMAGNVWEWVADWYSETYYSSQTTWRNPTGPSSGSLHVLRGGSFDDASWSFRSTVRGGGGASDGDVGFRCARREALP